MPMIHNQDHGSEHHHRPRQAHDTTTNLLSGYIVFNALSLTGFGLVELTQFGTPEERLAGLLLFGVLDVLLPLGVALMANRSFHRGRRH